MAYLVTGATGFIGRFLLEKLLARDEAVFVLVREESLNKWPELIERYGERATQLEVITGDLTLPELGISPEDKGKLKGKLKGIFHLAARYDLTLPAEAQYEINVEGTRKLVQLGNELGCECFHHVSSIAVAGLYPGIFREDMFEEAEDLVHPYFRSKHDAEAVVRDEVQGQFKIYRPGMVVGHSRTGEIDKIDGPYYFFKLIQKVRSLLPQWVPTLGIEGGFMNIVPVDYVVDAIDYLAHKEGLDSNCFHLTDTKPYRLGEVINLFAEAAAAPKMAMRLDAALLNVIPAYLRTLLSSLPPVRRATDTVLKDLGIPRQLFQLISYPTRFDNRDAQKALKGSGIQVPNLKSYAPVLWDYWARNLDPDLHVAKNLNQAVKGKTIVITGASSGIGLATTLKLAEAKAKLILIARNPERLEEVRDAVNERGGQAFTYRCNLTNMDSVEELTQRILEDHGPVDILINNAGRSIRRSIQNSYDRFHDYERTMQLNYFGALKMTMGLLPGMAEQQSGQVINISSIGVLTNAPRFSAYVASKSALDAFTRCAAAEYADLNIRFTTINMPLVKTPMIAPTGIYDYFPTLSPDDAAELVGKAIIERPKRVATRLGIFIQVLYNLFPKVTETLFNFTFRLFKDSSAAEGKEAVKALKKGKVSSEQVAISHFMRGIYM